jgi:transcriptional regulator with XRE-family HTH domain
MDTKQKECVRSDRVLADFSRDEQELRQRHVGRLLKAARENAGLRQSDVAKKLGYSSPQFISNWERGLSLPPLDRLPKLLVFLDIPRKTLIASFHRYYTGHLKLEMRRLTRLLSNRGRFGMSLPK